VKQFILLIVLTAIGTIGPIVVDPFIGVAVYYLFAVLRPQYMWSWALPAVVAWSWYVALGTLIAVGLYTTGIWRAPAAIELDEHRTTRIRPSLGYCGMVMYGVWVCLSYLMARNRYFAYPYFVEYLKIFVMFTASAIVLRTTRQAWVLYLLTAGVVGYVGYEMNAEYLLKGQLNIYVQGFGGYDNNAAGLVMAMGVPLCLFAWEGEKRWWRWLYFVCVPALLHAVLMSFSRGAMVSLMVGSPLLLLRSRHRVKMIGVLLLLTLAVPVLAGREIRARFSSVQDYEDDRSSMTRIATWNAGWRMALDYPVFGIGIRNSDLYSYDYGADFVGRAIHNQYLEVAADSGFPALAFYLLSFVGTLWSATSVRRRVKGNETEVARRAHAMASGIECSLFVFMVGAIFLYLGIVELTYLLLLLGSQLSVIVGEVPSTEPAPAARRAVDLNPMPVWPQGMYGARS
jgi:probable O-glycosylation ligase (exosortase A-associated)